MGVAQWAEIDVVSMTGEATQNEVQDDVNKAFCAGTAEERHP